MGFNSTLFLLNDTLGDIDRDPERWWKEASIHINRVQTVEFGPQSSVMTCHHADDTSIIAVGGNHFTVLSRMYQQHHHTPENKLEIVKHMADEMGYRVVKKQKRGK